MSTSLSLPVIVHVGSNPRLAVATSKANEFKLFDGSSGETFTADRVVPRDVIAGDALAKTMSSIPRYASLLIVLMSENGDNAVYETCAALEKVVLEPSSLQVHYMANDGSGTLSETLFYEDCVALARERTLPGIGRSSVNRFSGVSSFNVLIDDRAISVIVCNKLSTPILAALQCAPRRELWVLVSESSEPSKLVSLFSEMPGISELISQMNPPSAPTLESFLEAAVPMKDELDRLRRMLSTSALAAAPAARDHHSVSELEEEISLLEKDNEELTRILETVRHDFEARESQHARVIDQFEQENTALRRQLLEARGELEKKQAAPISVAPQPPAASREDASSAELEALLNAARARNAVLQDELTVTTQALQQSLRHCDEYKSRIDGLEQRAVDNEAKARFQTANTVDATHVANQQIERLKTEQAEQRRENLLLVNEFQQKEKRWQVELLESSDALNRALANYHQARTVVEMQSRTLEAAAASAMATQQLQTEELDHLVQQVRALSPQRRGVRARANEGLLLSPTPADGGGGTTSITFGESGVGIRSASLQGSHLYYHSAGGDRTSSLDGRERILNI